MKIRNKATRNILLLFEIHTFPRSDLPIFTSSLKEALEFIFIISFFGEIIEVCGAQEEAQPAIRAVFGLKANWYNLLL